MEGDGDRPEGGKMGPIVIVFREVERPEIEQKENMEARTFRPSPEEGAWERTSGEWLSPLQAPPVRVRQLLNMIPSQNQSITL